MTANELYEKVVALIAAGETEEAILLLKKSLQEQPHLGYYNEIVILTGQFNNWEKKRIRGLITEESEFNRINSELLDVVEKIRRKEAEAQLAKASPKPPTTAKQPLMNTSPDPLRVAQSYQAPPHPRSNKDQKAGFGGQLGTYLKGFLLISGLIFIIAVVIEMTSDPIQPLTPSHLNNGFGHDAANIPNNTTPLPDEPLRSLEELLAEADSEEEGDMGFSPADVLSLDTYSLQEQLGNTSWYHDGTGLIQFSPDGSYATYYNGWGQVIIQASTHLGAFTGVYQNTYLSDYGVVFITPPVQNRDLSITSTSSINGSSGTFVATRQ